MIQNTPGTGNRVSAKETDQEDRYLPARMINEFVYCPRLFYLMHVEGQFEHNAETTDGDHVHRRVDARTSSRWPTPFRVQSNAASLKRKRRRRGQQIELTEMTRQFMRAGIREANPDASEAEIQEMAADRLLHYHGTSLADVRRKQGLESRPQ